jgi:hypothetical protein
LAAFDALVEAIIGCYGKLHAFAHNQRRHREAQKFANKFRVSQELLDVGPFQAPLSETEEEPQESAQQALPAELEDYLN